MPISLRQLRDGTHAVCIAPSPATKTLISLAVNLRNECYRPVPTPVRGNAGVTVEDLRRSVSGHPPFVASSLDSAETNEDYLLGTVPADIAMP